MLGWGWRAGVEPERYLEGGFEECDEKGFDGWCCCCCCCCWGDGNTPVAEWLLRCGWWLWEGSDDKDWKGLMTGCCCCCCCCCCWCCWYGRGAVVSKEGMLPLDPPWSAALGLGESLKYRAGFGGADGPLGGEAEEEKKRTSCPKSMICSYWHIDCQKKRVKERCNFKP